MTILYFMNGTVHRNRKNLNDVEQKLQVTLIAFTLLVASLLLVIKTDKMEQERSGQPTQWLWNTPIKEIFEK